MLSDKAPVDSDAASGLTTDEDEVLLEPVSRVDDGVAVGTNGINVRDGVVYCNGEAGVAARKEDESAVVTLGTSNDAAGPRAIGGS